MGRRVTGLPKVEVKTEEEMPHGWRYHIFVDRGEGGGKPVEHIVFLSWVDHEHWSGGRHAPSRVIEALTGLLLERESSHPLPPTFDAATARRWFPEIDREMERLL